MENPFCSCFLFVLTVCFWGICILPDEPPIVESLPTVESLPVFDSPPVVESFEEDTSFPEENIPDEDYFFYDTSVNQWFRQRFFPIQDETPKSSDKTPIENGLP